MWKMNKILRKKISNLIPKFEYLMKSDFDKISKDMEKSQNINLDMDIV